MKTKEKRSKSILVRLTPTEHEKWKAEAARLSIDVTQFIRAFVNLGLDSIANKRD